MNKIESLKTYIKYCYKMMKSNQEIYHWWYGEAVKSCEKRIKELQNELV